MRSVGVDTHLDLNVAAALDHLGGLLGVEEFPTTLHGHGELLGWLGRFGPVVRVGVEGTGSYGAGLARFLRGAGVEVVEVDRPNRQARRRKGKTDTVDAIEAARAAQADRQLGAAKTRDGNVEAIRALVVAKRSARSTRITTVNQIRSLGFTAPEEIRQTLQRFSRRLIAKQAAGIRPRAGSDPVTFATKTAIRALGRRVLASTPNAKISTHFSQRWSPLPHPSCSLCTASVSTPPPRCWSPRVTTPTGCAPKPPGPTSAGSHPSRHPRAR
jgi:transposase